MSKRFDIADKLKKLSEIKEKPPILKPRNATAIEEQVEEPPTEVTKPPIQPRAMSIKDLAIPDSAYELFSIEMTSDSAEKEEITQLLSLREDPKVKLKWTVFRDPYMGEFDWLKRQGLGQIRDEPLIYGRDLDEGALVASHIGNYTFSMASHDLKTEPLVELFILGLDNAKKYDLTAFTEKKHVLTKVNAVPKDDLEKSLQFKNQITKKDREIRNYLTQIEEVKQELIKRERELSEKSTEIGALKKSTEKKDREIEDYSMQIEEVKQDPKVAQLEDSISALKLSLEEKEDIIMSRNSELEEVKRVLGSNEEELNNVKSKWRQADEQLRKLTSGLEEKKGLVASKDGLTKALTKEVKDLGSRVDAMKIELEEKDRKVKDFDSRVQGIQARLSDLKNIIGLDSRSREEIAKRLFGEKKELTTEDELDIIIEKHQEKEKLTSAKATEVEELKKQVKELTKAREDTDSMYQERDELLSAKDAEIEGLIKQVKELTGAREVRKEKPEALKKGGKKRILTLEKRVAEKMLKSILTESTNIAERRVKGRIYRKKIEDINKKIRELERA